MFSKRFIGVKNRDCVEKSSAATGLGLMLRKIPVMGNPGKHEYVH